MLIRALNNVADKILPTVSNSPFQPDRFHDLQIGANGQWLKLLVDIADYCYPGDLYKRYKLIFRSLLHPNIALAWYRQIANSPLLTKLAQKDSILVTKLHRLMLRQDYTIERRAKLLVDHYELVQRLFTPEFLHQALIQEGVRTSCINIAPDHNYELNLGFSGYPGKEGELAFYWRRQGEMSYLARVCFSLVHSGQSVAIYIGGIQGAKGKDARERVGEASKLCSGLSPKRAVMEGVFAMAKTIEATAIYAVSDRQQISNKKHSKHFSYDNFWLELSSQLDSNGNFALPLVPIRKNIFDAPTKRRAKYRRQHAYLDGLYRDTIEAIKNA
jgi:uncharacterized protein VirK/YbjX